MLTGYVSMPTAMLAPRRVAGVKFSVLPICVAMIFAMPTAAAVTVTIVANDHLPLALVILFHDLPEDRTVADAADVALLRQHLSVFGIRRATRLTLGVAVCAAALGTALLPIAALAALALDLAWLDRLLLSLGLALHLLLDRALGALRSALLACLLALIARRFARDVVALATLVILRHRRHRHAGRKQDTQ